MPPQSGKSFRAILNIPPSTPTPASTVLLIIDAQNEYATGQLAIHDVAKSRAVIAQVLAKWRQSDGHIVHILHETPAGAPIFTPGTALAEEFDELRDPEGREKIIRKQQPGAFTGTDLGAVLEGWGKKGLLLVGYMAHVCISNTSRAAAELGYDVSVLADGIGDRDIPGASAKQLVDITLAELGDVSATVVRSGEL